MKFVLTGSLGHISKPLAGILVRQGHTVTVISSNPGRVQAIEALGAVPAIGSLEDPAFLAATFKGADAVYLMEPPGNFFDPNFDIHEHVARLARNFVEAVQNSGVRRVVHLSSIGAHTDKDNGLLKFHYNVEKILGQLPADVAICFMRPVGFYYNLLGFIPVIRSQGAILTNYGGNDKEPWVSPLDIAATIASTITQPFEGRSVQYIASDECSPDEVASILGAAIGNPDLKWVAIPDEQLLNEMLAAGMNPTVARGLVEMNAARRGGRLYEDYFRHRPALGKVKMTEFANEFAAAYAGVGAGERAAMRTVLITGANKGIGLETARQLARMGGYFVYIGSRDKVKGEAAINQLDSEGITNVELILIDVADDESIRHARETLQARIDALDILINNAGIAGAQPQHIATTDIRNLRAVFETNFFGAVQTTQAFLPLLERSAAPVIVNVSSELGSLARHSSAERDPNWDNYDAYSCSKTALNAFTLALANQFRSTKFRINSVTPGFTATDLNQHRGPQPVAEGAKHIVRHAIIGPDGPTGKFLKDGIVAW
ncbi:MAG TPA: SDR family NAD(P)-dependent oxidoreductase [Puia sp.]|nr:SDR family NAD(P)-dependent oxidoreductase [Puia sp.]